MNGARAEDWAKMSSAPSTTRTTTIGSSQSFLFCRRNSQTSPASESLPMKTSLLRISQSSPLEQALELLARLARAFARYPVALPPLRASPQRVAPQEARDEAVGRERAVEHQRQKYAAVHVAERGRKPHPRVVEGARRRPDEQPRDEQERAERAEDEDHACPPAVKIPRGDQEKHGGDHERRLARLPVGHALFALGCDTALRLNQAGTPPARTSLH